jgi:outer membrane cobalamin receptor
MLAFPLFAQEAAWVDDDFDDEEFNEDMLQMEGSGITVTATRETTPQMEVVEQEEIERRQAPDLATLLEETLDIGITAKGAYGNQTQINIRGFSTERIGILINGVPANDPRTGEFDMSTVDLNNVERIEVIYGGSDSTYNVTGAMGGTINIITKKKQPEGWTFGGGISNIGYLTGRYNKRHSGGQVGDTHWEDLVDTQMVNVFAAYGGEQFSSKVTWFGDSARNHYLYKDEKGFARRKESNEVLDTGGSLLFDYNLPDNGTLETLTDLFFARRHFPVTGTSLGYARTSDYKIKETLSFNMPVFFRDDLSGEGSLGLVFSGNHYGAVSSSTDQYLTGVTRWGWYPFSVLTLRLGLDWRFIHVDSTDNGETIGNQGGAYLTGEFKPFKPLILVASVKGITDTEQAAVVPKGGLVWKISERENFQAVIRNNYFRCYKFPDFDDLYSRSFDGLYYGNPDLEPEDGFGMDLTGEISAGPLFSVSSTVYGQWNVNAIHWVKHGARWTPENVGYSFFVGGDIRPNLTFRFEKGPFKKLGIGLTYQLQFSWLLTDDLTYDNALRIPYMPMHIAGASIDLAWKTGSFLASAHYESLRFADVNNRMPLDPYWLVNVTVNQDIGSHVTAFFIVRNALNWLYTSFAEYPMPGLGFTTGVRLKFGWKKAAPDGGNGTGL